MATKPRYPMPISQRAKQFMPFSALKGLNEALALKEKERLELNKSHSTLENSINFSPFPSISPEDIPLW